MKRKITAMILAVMLAAGLSISSYADDGERNYQIKAVALQSEDASQTSREQIRNGIISISIASLMTVSIAVYYVIRHKKHPEEIV